MPEWVVVATYPGRHVAEMMLELLANEGVVATIAVDDTGGLHPQLALTQGVRLRVHPADEERARVVLARGGAADDS